MNNLAHSELESKRFSMSIARGYAETINEKLLDSVKNTVADLIILRVPAGELINVKKLREVCSDIIVADTLVYYTCDLRKQEEFDLTNQDLVFKLATDSDQEILKKLIAQSFTGYKNHYSANPYLAAEKITEGFQEWGNSFLSLGKDVVCWIAYKNNVPAAFCCCRKGKDSFEGVLYGVHPEFAGGGIYGDLIAFTQRKAREYEYNTMLVSTQIDNYAVQKAWTKRGFKLDKAVNTLHLNFHKESV